MWAGFEGALATLATVAAVVALRPTAVPTPGTANDSATTPAIVATFLSAPLIS